MNFVPTAWCTNKQRYRLNAFWGEHGSMPSINSSKTCELSTGIKNSAVGTLQFTLNKCYGKSLTLDDDFGPATRSALQQVQSTLGLVADGVYGVNTRAAMKFTASYGGCVAASAISNTVWQ